MQDSARVLPEQASTIAERVDTLYGLLVAMTAVVAVAVAGAILLFVVRYRRTRDRRVGDVIREPLWLEITWMIAPLVVWLSFFAGGATVFFDATTVPPGALRIDVVGKQWMWKMQHAGGQREINHLHIPIGRPIRLVLASEDVIHSFYVPAFRIKRDAVPGAQTEVWFEATKPGTYRLFCAEYCGTQHSGMTGFVTAMTAGDFEQWLSGSLDAPSLPEQGRAIVSRIGCLSCHGERSTARGPALEGVFGSTVRLKSGETVVADEAYLRESILVPGAKIVAGYENLMPTYRGLVGEEDLIKVVAYLKSLKREERRP